jgi:thiol-disulfide isomerase/thioredoxin
MLLSHLYTKAQTTFITPVKLNLTPFSREADSVTVEVQLFDSFLGRQYQFLKNYFVPSAPVIVNIPLPEISLGIINVKNKEKIITSSGSVIFNGDTLVGNLGNYQELVVRGGENEFMQYNYMLPFSLPALITNNKSYDPILVRRSYDLQIPENPRLQAIYAEYSRNVLTLIRQQPNSFHLLRKLNDNASNITLKTLDTAISLLSERVLNTTEGKKLKTTIANRRWLINNPDLSIIELMDTKGMATTLASVIDTTKFTFIDFWASWCVPCRSFNKELAIKYAGIDSTRIKIVSISIDEDLEKWKKALQTDQIGWPNFIDPGLNGFEGKIPQLFNIKYIPQSFLFAKDGSIIKTDISIEELLLIRK